jgi:hypothetical protein
MEIRPFTPHLTLIGLMIVTSLALAFTVDVTLSDQAGIQMRLPVMLDSGWIGDELRYSHDPENLRQYRVSELDLPNIDPKTGEKLYTMTLVEYEALPQDTQFVKSIYTNTVADQVFVSIVLSGRERNSIHRPQRCLPGQGNTIENTDYMTIPIEGRDPLRICILETVQTFTDENSKQKAYHGYYAYWFVGQNRETASHYVRMFWLAWDRVIHSVAHKWAYIAVSGTRDEGSKEYRQKIMDFIQELYPELLIAQNDS